MWVYEIPSGGCGLRRGLVAALAVLLLLAAAAGPALAASSRRQQAWIEAGECVHVVWSDGQHGTTAAPAAAASELAS